MRGLWSYIVIFAIVALVACSPAEGDFRGSEYMPDMAHSVAYEANLYNYYGLNTFSDRDEYRKYAEPGLPVEGTVPRGAAGSSSKMQGHFNGLTQNNEISIPQNGSKAYDYGNTDDERTRAAREIRSNPFPITNDGLATGKELYELFCGICHGNKGQGDGYLARENSPYGAVPANLVEQKFQDTTDGIFYHAIMHGKNVMGSYSDKISYEERWQVIHYIRSLQAKEAGSEYSASQNTFNASGTPIESMDVHEMHFTNDDIFMVKSSHSGHSGHGGGDGEHKDDGHGNHDSQEGDSHSGDENHEGHNPGEMDSLNHIEGDSLEGHGHDHGEHKDH